MPAIPEAQPVENQSLQARYSPDGICQARYVISLCDGADVARGVGRGMVIAP